MNHTTTTLNTKKMLSSSLKKLIGEKPLSKITISDIATDCHINRKTFYYHFNSIQDLLKWTLELETTEVVKNFVELTRYEDAIVFVIDYVKKNHHLLNCIYDAMGREELKRFFYNDFKDIFSEIIEHIEEETNQMVSDSYKDFIIGFYSEAIAGSIIDLFKAEQHYDSDKLIQYVSQILRVSLPCVIASEPTEESELSSVSLRF